MSFKDSLQNKKVLVFGLGLQGGGVGDALWLKEQRAEVRVTDLKPESALTASLKSLPADITATLGQHRDEDIKWADIIIKNPGVPDDQPQLKLARELGKPVYTSAALVVSEARDKTIGITGTRGKTTVTELIYAILSKHFPGQVVKGGNLAGTALLPLLDQIQTAKYLVLELSSFQLAGFHDLQVSPRYSILTNIYPDHLNRYPDMDAYMDDKAAIFRYQSSQDFLFVNSANDPAVKLTESSPSKRILYSRDDVPESWHPRLMGAHNLENIAAALALTRTLALPDTETKSVVESFSTIPFRLELIRELDGVKYYNDTTSTTPTATIKAMEAMTSPFVIILGGDDKKLPYDSLLTALKHSTELKRIILIGCKNIPQFVADLKKSSGPLIHSQVFTMREAVQNAHRLAKSGDSVLLSPGFTSFDLFENEFARGRQFNEEVAKLT